MGSNAASQAIDQKYQALGGQSFLGPAVTQLVADVGIGGAPGFHVDYEGGSIYWSATTGAHVIYGDIRLKWLSVGGPKSNIGYPKTDEAPTADNKSRFTDFAVDGHDTGAIYWTPDQGAHLIYGLIWLKWLSVGGETSNLGYPITDEASSPDNKSRFNNFGMDGHDTGAIYWTPAQGAHLIYGEIWLKWLSIGGEGSNLGYPITDEASTPDNICRFNDFAMDGHATGSIYWTPSGGAHLIYGEVWLKWNSLSGEAGPLGYPTTDETSAGDNNGRYNDFSKGGTIYWSPATGAHALVGGNPTELAWTVNFTFPSGTNAGGWTTLKVFSNGAFEFTGNFHDSGPTAYDYSVACVFVDADKKAWTAGHAGRIAGTLTPGSKDDPINESGNNPALARNWRAIAAGNQALRGRAQTSVSVEDILIALISAAGAVGAAIALV
ncbi:hypothetical protein FGG08_006612 [Glutinoglossum americanum]|uniref:Uncharacterized protein n=1 Tax=Glutinoglossum americanum TaxID=1670608 RepID=A0A9P8KUS9_9PEZI|nr:hypothetical protein FGG08_006612 [Glutinoglossum americanum]